MRKCNTSSTTTTTTTPTLADLLAPSLRSRGWIFRERDPIRRHDLGRCELIVVPACRWRLWRRLHATPDNPRQSDGGPTVPPPGRPDDAAERTLNGRSTSAAPA